jgi:hypothetical protein
MKLQSFSVIFTLVLLPLILILSYYIQLQVDTITLQKEYDTDLLNATYDAMSSFEINTANEDLSSVSDSLRTIIDASSNIFFSALSSNLGMSNASKSYVEPYIPSILYTLYDGYYIYAPTKVPTVLTDSDGNAVLVGDLGVTTTDGGSNYKYTEYDEESDSFKNLSDSEKSKLYIKSSDLKNTADYGQLLYLKKGTTDSYTADISQAELKIDNVLKTYMPYSARYVREDANIDITTVYTLDNYLTIQGNVGNGYYTKSGYLIPENSVEISVNGNSNYLINYNQNDAQRIIEKEIQEGLGAVTVKISSGETFTAGVDSNGNTIIADEYEKDISSLETQLKNAQQSIYNLNTLSADTYKDVVETAQNVINSIHNKTTDYTYNSNFAMVEPKVVLNQIIEDCTTEINIRQYELDKISAAVYYAKAKIFSDWVYTNLKPYVREKDLVEISGQELYTTVNGSEEIIYDFSNSEKLVFEVTNSESSDEENSSTEIDKDSTYYTHKLNVIRNSIQYNLNLTMSTYNMNEVYKFYYEMPVISSEKWDGILSNVSIVSFMQGLNCGLKTYSNYMIVSSTNNELLISADDLYYVPKDDFNKEEAEYHKINCKNNIELDSSLGRNVEYIAFTSKEVKYDKIYDKTTDTYEYDHKNFACYRCVNDRNYQETNIFDSTLANYSEYANLRKAYYIGVGKERNNIYKMNAVDKSEGYEIIYDYDTDNVVNANYVNKASSLDLKNVRAIEIIVGSITTTDRNETTATYTVSVNGVTVNDVQYSLTTNSSVYYTILAEVDPNKATSQKISFNNITLNNINPDSTVTTDIKDAIKFIRVIYK